MASLCAAVDALDVEGRVGLGIAARLRLLEHGFERRTRPAHFREDEIAGAVDDAGDPGDAIGGQALAQRLDDRDPAADGRFEGHHRRRPSAPPRRSRCRAPRAAPCWPLPRACRVRSPPAPADAPSRCRRSARARCRRRPGAPARPHLRTPRRRRPPAAARVPFCGVRVAICVMRIGRPARRVISSALRCSTVHVPRPTVPRPSRPTRIGCMGALDHYAAPSSRNICLMPRMACRVRGSFSIRAKRTCPSPNSPNPMPGDTDTLACASSFLVNSSEPSGR